MKKKIMTVFGTRPDAIKMCPLVIELHKHASKFDTVVCVTGQHREMLHQVLDFFHVRPDINLDIMKDGQTLEGITKMVLDGIGCAIAKEAPDIVLVHGDTTTAFAAAMAAFYRKVPVGHVEAGLRSGDMTAPYPEEFNRRAVALMTNLHFAPTRWAQDNLLKEGVDPESVFVTGNTVVDAMKYTVSPQYDHELLRWVGGNRLLLFTAHRRENIGQPLLSMFQALLRLAERFADIRILFPVHYNPLVRDVAKKYLGSHPNIRLIEPLGLFDFHNIMARSYLVLTDSGGVQEEASSLNKPVLVMREKTERPEGIMTGALKLVGTDEEAIFAAAAELLSAPAGGIGASAKMSPYGDGEACGRIIEILQR